MHGDFLGYFEKHQVKFCVDNFWVTIKKLATFYFNIWSHWLFSRLISVAIFGKISPLWQKIKVFNNSFESLGSQNLQCGFAKQSNSHWTNFKSSQWPNIEQILSPSRHFYSLRMNRSAKEVEAKRSHSFGILFDETKILWRIIYLLDSTEFLISRIVMLPTLISSSLVNLP